MKGSVDNGQQRKFALGTWPLSAVFAILVSIAASLLMQWRIGSPQLMVITIASLLLATLFIGVYRSRGRFRLHALLVLMTLAGVGSATIGRQIVYVEKHRALVRSIAERNGRVIVWGASKQEFDGWRIVPGGYAFPSWLHPLYDYFANIRVGQIIIPADLLTMENLELLPFDDDLRGSEVILEGTLRDQNALQKFISFHKLDPILVRSNHFTELEIRYLSEFKGKPLHLIFESPSLNDIRRLQQFEIENPWTNDWEIDASDPPGFATVVEVDLNYGDLVIKESVLSRETIASIEVFSKSRVLEIKNSTLEPGTFDEIANLTKIRYLGFKRCVVTDGDLLALSRNDKIEYLSFIGTQITDSGLEALSSMKQLKRIELTNSKVTWNGVRELCGKLKLESLKTDVTAPSTGSPALLPQPIFYRDEMIREKILKEKEPKAVNPTD